MIARRGIGARRRWTAIAIAAAVVAALAGGVVVFLKEPFPAAHAGNRLAAREAHGHARGGGEAGGKAAPVDPALFSAGSCIAYPARGTHPGGKTVFLDAGHGGPDPGGVGETEGGTEISEAQVNLRIEMDAMRMLTAEGYRVVVSRTTPGAVARLGPGDTDGSEFTVSGSHKDVLARDACADMGHADLLVGIYMNSGWGGAGSVTAWDAARSFSRSNHQFAKLLQADVLGKLNRAGYGIPDGGVQSDTGLGSELSAQGPAYGHLVLLGPPMRGYVSTPSRMPGALIEPLFITDPFEASAADSPAAQRLIAAGIAEAVGQYFSSG